MPRRNEGPRLKWHRYGAAFYICWTEHGRSRERSTGSDNREQAEAVFAEWLSTRQRPNGASDPAKVLVTDILNDYASERGPKIVGKETLARCIETLAKLWEGKTVAEVPSHVDTYTKRRARSVGTMRRELGVLQAAINYAHKRGKLTRTVSVELPAAPPSKERWLTRQEAARLICELRRDRTARLYAPLFILIGLYTGRRKEAILALRWPQVNVDAGVIDFRAPGEVETQKEAWPIPHSVAAATASQTRSPPRLRSRLRAAHQRQAHRQHQERVCSRVQASKSRRRNAPHATAYSGHVAHAERS